MTRKHPEALAQLAVSLAGQFRIEPIEIPAAPIFLAAAWPEYEGVTGLKPRLPSGRGISPAEAMLSAAAEAIELRASLAQNHRENGLVTVQRGEHAHVVARDLLRGDDVKVSAQQVYLDFAAINQEPQVFDADSTGCASGATQEEAIERGLLECIERDAMALWWHGRLRRPQVALDVIDSAQPRLGWWLQERPRKTTLFDITADSAASVVAACSANPDGTFIATGSAARFTLAEAALAATTEMLQTETALQIASAAGDPDAEAWIEGASIHDMKQLQPLAPSETSAARTSDLDGLLRGLAYDELRALFVNLTLPGDPIATVRVLVPGLCAMGRRLDAPRFVRLTGLPASTIDSDALEPF